MELIDKAAVVAEIERLKSIYSEDENIHHVARYNLLVDILTFLNILEVKETVAEQEGVCNGVFNVKEQDDHRAKIAEREYWRKLRGDIFIAMLNKSDYKIQLLDDVNYIVGALKAQDQKLF